MNIFDKIEQLKVPVNEAEASSIILETVFMNNSEEKPIVFKITYSDTCTLGDSENEYPIYTLLNNINAEYI